MMTRDAIVKNALNDAFVMKLLERLSSDERVYVESFAVNMAGAAEEAITKAHSAVNGKMPINGITDSKGAKDAV